MFIVLGWDESINECDCCGKSPLSGTFTVQNETGDLLHYGSTCVTRNTGKDKKEINSDIKKHEVEMIKKAADEYHCSGVEQEYEAKRAEAKRNGLTHGKAFAEYCRAECFTARAMKIAIAEKYGIKTSQF